MSSSKTTQRLTQRRNVGSKRSPRASVSKPTSRLARSRRKKPPGGDGSHGDRVSDDSGDVLSCRGPRRRRSEKRKSLDDLDHDDEEICTDELHNEGHTAQNVRLGETEVMASSPQLPEKSVLQLVIDILQRRDTYEAFGEPVDPGEVADYYVVVKEPMDFGTMRAKLHEGMYTRLEEFEHDAFLIPKNAMLFNPPSSVYFKQAQAMEELAKKAFHLLKTEPEKLRTEFSETRRRSRRLPPEPVNGKRKRGGSTQVKPHNTNTNISPSSHLKPSMSTYSYADKASTQSCSLIGATRSNKEARSTYEPWMYFSRGSDSIVSTVYRSSKRLEGVDEKKMSYKDSLMRFAQGLGPIAQKIAARKLQLQPQGEVPNGFQVQLKPASFQYPAVSSTQESSKFPSTLTPSTTPNTSLALDQEPSTRVKNAIVMCIEDKAHIGERPDGNSAARQETGIDREEKRNAQTSRAGGVSAPESHGRGICLALRSEDTVKGRRRTHPDGNVNTGFSSQPGKLPAIQSGANGANSTMKTDSSQPQCLQRYGPRTSSNFQTDALFSGMNGMAAMPEQVKFSQFFNGTILAERAHLPPFTSELNQQMQSASHSMLDRTPLNQMNFIPDKWPCIHLKGNPTGALTKIQTFDSHSKCITFQKFEVKFEWKCK